MSIATQLANLALFLEQRGWTRTKEGDRFTTYLAPEVLGMDGPYSLALPRGVEAPDAAQFLERLTAIVSSLYSVPPDQLRIILDEADTVLSLRMIGRNTQFGSIPLVSFEGMIEKLRKLLQDTATFVLTEAPIVEVIPEEASYYLNHCRFLQTQAGSFTASVQLPAGLNLVSADLFNQGAELRTSTVDDRLEAALGFAFGRVLRDDPMIYSDEFIRDSMDVLNADVLHDIGDIIDRVATDELHVTFHRPAGATSVSSGRLTDEQRRRVIDYSNYFRARVEPSVDLDMVGRIIELRSRNPERNRNYVLVAGVFDDREALVAIRLNNRDYPAAIEAHGRNRLVRVSGLARRMKTQFSITRLRIFEEVR